MLSETLKPLGESEVISIDNKTCVYCGKEFVSGKSTKEHVIGRRFIPKGTLNKQWNLIVKACRQCNNIKSELENDISAITMQPDAWGRHASDDPILAEEAARKAIRSHSSYTNKPVADSKESFKITTPSHQGISTNFDFTAPPQIESNRAYHLAQMQIMAFFYFVTYDHKTNIGKFWLEGFYPLYCTQKLDWGNDILISFMKSVVEWEPRVIGGGAGGFFRIAIRKHPAADCWSWALEWNRNYRLAGFFGNKDATDVMVDTYPKLATKNILESPGVSISYMKEKTLDEDDDQLFVWDDGLD